MRPLPESARANGAGFNPAAVTVPAGPRGIRTPANLLPAPRGGIAFPILSAASLLIHAVVIGAVIVDFRSSQSKAKPPPPAVQVEVVEEPPVLLHPMEPSASARLLPLPA